MPTLTVESRMAEVLLEANRRGLISVEPQSEAFKRLLEDLEVPSRAWHVWGTRLAARLEG